MDQKPCSPIAGDVALIQYFQVDDDDLTGVEMTVATYFKSVDRLMTFRLYLIDDLIDEGDMYRAISATIERNNPFATASKADWTDNEIFTLPIDPPATSGSARYALHVSAAAQPGPEVTIWLHGASSRMSGHIAAWYDGVDQGVFGSKARLVASNPKADSPVPQAILYSPVTQCNLHCISAETRSAKATLASAPLPASYARVSHTKCRVAWGSAVIMGNGDVAVCCVPRTTIGNLHRNSMEEI